MKIDIVRADANGKFEGIKNYKSVCIDRDGSINYLEISDAECEEVRAIDVIDTFYTGDFEQNLLSLLKKIRMNGKIVLSGCDCNILSRMLIQRQVDEKYYSSIVSNKNSMSSIKTVSSILKGFGLKIETQRFTGSNYEIVATRG
tara:strand:- start:13 stop:444 length:432 start_codon:yes stop_codon:yes gene_type:complete